MPEVRSGEVNSSRTRLAAIRRAFVDFAAPVRLDSVGGKKGPERVVGADIVRGQKGPVNDGSRSSTHNVSTGDVFQY